MNMNILKNINFTRFIVGQAVSNLGSNLQQFALSLYVLSITQSATLFAAIVAIAILPRLLLSPVAGVMGDWFDRKKMLTSMDFLNALVIGLTALSFSLTGTLSVPLIFGIVIYLEIIEIFYGSSLSAVVPSLVTKEELFNANSIKTVLNSLSGIIAPLLAALLFETFGLFIVLMINSISFLLAALNELTLNIPMTHKAPQKINLQHFIVDFKEGLDIIKKNQGIKNLISLGVVLNFCLDPLFGIGLIYVIKTTLHSSALQFGLFGSIFGASMLIGPLLLGKWAQSMPTGKLINVTFSLVTLCVGAIAIVPYTGFLNLFSSNWIPYTLLLSICFIVGMLTSMSNIALRTLFQTIVPHEFMGRTASVMNMGLMAAMPIGQMLIGVALDVISPVIVIAIIALILFIAIRYYGKGLLLLDEIPETQSA